MGLFGFGKQTNFLSIDFGASALKLGRARVKGGKRLDFSLVDSISVQNFSSEDYVERSIAALKKSVDKNKLSKNQPVIIGLPASDVIIRRLELPAMPEDRLKKVIGYEAESHIPFPVDQVVMDHHLIARDQDGVEVLLAAVKETNLDKYLEIVEGAGLTPSVVDVTAFAYFNLFQFIQDNQGKKADRGVKALVDIGHGNTDIMVFEGKNLQFARSASVAGKALTGAIAEEFEVEPAEAAALKHQYGHIPLGKSSDEGTATGTKTGESLSRLAERRKQDEKPPSPPPPPPPPEESLEKPADESEHEKEEEDKPRPPSGDQSLTQPQEEAEKSEDEETEELSESIESTEISQDSPSEVDTESDEPADSEVETGQTSDKAISRDEIEQKLGLGKPRKPRGKQKTVEESKEDDEFELEGGILEEELEEEDGEGLLDDELDDDDSLSLGAAELNDQVETNDEAAEKSRRVGAAVNPRMNRLVGELRHTFDYFQSELGGGEITEIIVSGGSSKLNNLPEFISDGLGIQTVLFKPGDSIRGVNTVKIPEFAVSAGLQLRARPASCLLGFDLTPGELIVKKRRSQQKKRQRLLGLLLMLFALLLLLTGALFYQRRARELEVTEEILERLDPVVAQVEDLQVAEEEIRRRLQLIQNLEDQKSDILALLWEIEQFPRPDYGPELRERTWFESFDYTKDEPEGTFTIQGVTGNYEDASRVFRWMENRDHIISQISENMSTQEFVIEGEEWDMISFSARYSIAFGAER